MKIINAIIDGKTTKLVKVNEFYPHMKVKNYYFISEDDIIYNKTSKGYRARKWLTNGTPGTKHMQLKDNNNKRQNLTVSKTFRANFDLLTLMQVCDIKEKYLNEVFNFNFPKAYKITSDGEIFRNNIKINKPSNNYYYIIVNGDKYRLDIDKNFDINKKYNVTLIESTSIDKIVDSIIPVANKEKKEQQLGIYEFVYFNTKPSLMNIIKRNKLHYSYVIKDIDHNEHDRFVSKFFKSKIEDIVSVKEGMFKVEVTEVYI